jgi:hypothetical protein
MTVAAVALTLPDLSTADMSILSVETPYSSGGAGDSDAVLSTEPVVAVTPLPRYNRFGHRFKRQQNKMLVGDNLALFLNSDPDIVEKYRRQYQVAAGNSSVTAVSIAADDDEDVSLRGLGNAVLSSQIYRFKSESRCKALRRRREQAKKTATISLSSTVLPRPADIDCENDVLADSTTVQLDALMDGSTFET